MSNRITIQRTVFQDLRKGTEAEKSLGYRMYDDFDQTYDNTLTIEQLQGSDEELLRHVRDYGDEVSGAMLDFILEGHGLFIDHDWHDWEWVKKALDITD